MDECIAGWMNGWIMINRFIPGKKNYHIIDWLGTGYHDLEDTLANEK